MPSTTPNHDATPSGTRGVWAVILAWFIWFIIASTLDVCGLIGLIPRAVAFSLLAGMSFVMIPAGWVAGRRVFLNWWAPVVVFSGCWALWYGTGALGWLGSNSALIGSICALVALLRDPWVRKRLDI